MSRECTGKTTVAAAAARERAIERAHASGMVSVSEIGKENGGAREGVDGQVGEERCR